MDRTEYPHLKRRLLSVALASTMLIGCFTAASVPSGYEMSATLSVSAASEVQNDGDWSYVVLDDGNASVTGYTGSSTAVTLPTKLNGVTVTTLGGGAFVDNNDIEELIIPEGYTLIDRQAVKNCDSLESISLPSTLVKIGERAITYCDRLSVIEVPSSVETIGQRAFEQNKALSELTLNEGLKYCQSGIIEGTAVSSVYIPSTLISAEFVFEGAEYLTDITFAEGLKKIPNKMFRNSRIRNIILPETITEIGESAFEQCDYLQLAVIPDSVTAIGDWAFYSCDRLTSVTIGTGIKEIPYECFYGCKALTSVTVPDNVEVIGGGAFHDCVNLKSVTLNEGLKNIYSGAFENTALIEVTLPLSVTETEKPFYNSKKLKKINLPEGIKVIPRGLYQGTGVTAVTLPEGIKTISQEAFRECSALKTISLPESLREIGANAFNGCSSLSAVDLPEKLTTIGTYAFAGCTSLKEFYVPAKVQEIGSGAFYESTALSKVTINEGVIKLGDSIFEKTAVTDIYFPSTVTEANKPLRNSAIKSVTIGDRLLAIPNNAFRDAHELTAITIPDSVTKIGDSAFEECHSLQTLVIPDSVLEIGQYMCYNCHSLSEVKLGSGISKLRHEDFYGCESLQSIEIPDSVTESDNSVFHGCTSLGTVSLPQGLKCIANDMFRGCTSLTTVTASDELERINGGAFYGCTSLSRIISAAQDIRFENTAFYGCANFSDKRFRVFDNAEITSTGNIGVDGSLIYYTVKYKVRSDWDNDQLSVSRLRLFIPDNIEPIESSFSAKGFELDENQSMDNISLNGCTEGELHFSAYLSGEYDADSAKKMSANVELRYRDINYEQSLGEVDITTSKCSLSAPMTTSDKSVAVSGYADGSDKVQIVINNTSGSSGSITHEVSVNPYTGKYMTDSLPLAKDKSKINDGDSFEVYAISGDNKSDVSVFTYDPAAVEVEKVTGIFNAPRRTFGGKITATDWTSGKKYDLTRMFNVGASPLITINPSCPIRFEFDLKNDEDVAFVFLWSKKGDEYKIMEAFYDADTDKWIAEGYFDPDNMSYVPGEISVFYLRGQRMDRYGKEDEEIKSTNTGGYWRRISHGAIDAFEWVSDIGDIMDMFSYDEDTDTYQPANETVKDVLIDTGGSVFIDLVTGDLPGAAADTVTGGLHVLWTWGNENDNLFSLMHGGWTIDEHGNAVPKGGWDKYQNGGYKKGGKARYIVDPSGTVYEAVRGNTLAGATATLYKLDKDTGNWNKWNAEDFEQENPIVTDSLGMYSWLTDEGTFKVKIEKEGYETQESEPFDIPPEKLGLDFNLVDSKTKPVMTVTADEDAPERFYISFSKYMQPKTVLDNIVIAGVSECKLEAIYDEEEDLYAREYLLTITSKEKGKLIVRINDKALSYSGAAATPADVELDYDTGTTPPTKITIPDSAVLNIGDSTELVPELEPMGAETAIAWISSDENVVTVENGKVVAVGAGTATVTATTENGLSAECIVTVNADTGDVITGDVNGDGSADIADALMAARYDAGLMSLSDKQLSAGDVNHDGSVDIADALMIARYDAGLAEFR